MVTRTWSYIGLLALGMPILLALLTIKSASTHAAGVKEASMEQATFGAGCFWGVEAAFRQVEGVIATTVGYAGGTAKNPSYEQVCGGKTGHTEVVQVTYNAKKVSYEKLLEVFWACHNPTIAQKAQYKSVIFYYTPEQLNAAEADKAQLAKSGARGKQPILTEILPVPTFYPAEEYHQQYYEKRGIAPHCGIG